MTFEHITLGQRVLFGTGSTAEPAVGYSLGHPIGVTVAIVAVAAVVNRSWPARRDPEPAASLGLDACTVLGLDACTALVKKRTRFEDVPGFADQSVLISYLARDGRTRVATPGEELRRGDRVVVVGPHARVNQAVAHLGERDTEHLADDRRAADYRRFVVSSRRVAGRSIAELDIPGRFGDRVLAVVPSDDLKAVSRYLGDSEQRVSEIDALTVGIGMALGLGLGLVTIPLPGGTSFSLGAAAGPLLVGMILGGMILGGIERTRPIVWGMPAAANRTIRQLGLLFLLTAVGLFSGQDFAVQAFTLVGLRVVISAVLIVVVAASVMLLLARLLGVSAPRASGALAGLVGQPAALAFAGTRVWSTRGSRLAMPRSSRWGSS